MKADSLRLFLLLAVSSSPWSYGWQSSLHRFRSPLPKLLSHSRGKELSNAPQGSPDNNNKDQTQASTRAEYEQRVRAACYDRRRGDEAVLLLREMPASALYGGLGARGPPSERAFRNRALGWLSRRGLWQQALAVFEDDLKANAAAAALNPSVASSGSAIQGTGKPYVSVPPDEYTWAAVLSACGEARPPQWRKALELLDRMQDQEIDCMQDQEVEEETSDTATVATIGEAAAREEKAQLTDESAKVEEEADEEDNSLGVEMGRGKEATAGGVLVSAIHVGLAMKACSRAGRVQEVLELLDQTPVLTQNPPTLILWNQAVGACASKGMLRVILDQLLPAMEEAASSSSSSPDVQPDVWTYNLALKATEVRGDVVGAKALMSTMTTSGIGKDVITYNTALATAAASRSVLGTQWALQLLQEMAPVGTTTETVRRGDSKMNRKDAPEESRGSGVDIKKNDVQLSGGSDEDEDGSLVIPDNRTLCAALAALSGSGQHWREALDLLHASLPSGPSIRVFNAALDAIGAENGQVHLVGDLLHLLSAGGLTPDRYTLNTVLKAYSKQGDVDTCISLLRSLNTATSSSNQLDIQTEKESSKLFLDDEKSEIITSRDTNTFEDSSQQEQSVVREGTRTPARTAVTAATSTAEVSLSSSENNGLTSTPAPLITEKSTQRQNYSNKNKKKGRGPVRRSSSFHPDGPGWRLPPSIPTTPLNSENNGIISDGIRSSRIVRSFRSSSSTSSSANTLASWFASHGLVPRARDFNVALDACQQRAADLALNRPMAARRGPLSDGRGIGEVRCSVLTKDGAKVVAQVRELLAAMECANLVPDDYAYSAAIIACGRAGDPNAALQLFSEMEDRAAAAARSAVGELYNENEDDDTVSATASDDLLFATSSGADAAAVTDNVKSKRMKKKEWTPRAPNPHCYRAALSVCQAYARAPEAKRLLRQLTSTRSATAVDYSYALQTCERAGDWQGAVEVVNEMQIFTASSSSGGAVEQRQQASLTTGKYSQDDNDDPTTSIIYGVTSDEVQGFGGIQNGDISQNNPSTPGTRLKGRSSVRAQALELLASQVASLSSSSDIVNESDEQEIGATFSEDNHNEYDHENNDNDGNIENMNENSGTQRSTATTSSSPPPSIDRAVYEKERSRAINAAVVVCAGAGQWEAARSLIATMEKQHGKHAVNQVAYSATIEALAAAGEFNAALDLFDELVSAPTPLQSSLSRSSPSPSVVAEQEVVSDLVEEKSRADVVACGAAMEAAGCLEDWAKCWQIFEEAQEAFGLLATPSMQALAMQALRHMGNWKAALTLVDQLTSSSSSSTYAAGNTFSSEVKEVGKTTSSPPLAAAGATLTQEDAVSQSLSRTEMVVVECALACAEAQANARRQEGDKLATATHSGSTGALSADGDDKNAADAWFEFGLPLLLAKLPPVPSAAALDALFYGLDRLLSATEAHNPASMALINWSSALYAALVESGRLPPCIIVSSTTTSSVASSSSNIAVSSSDSDTALVEVDLALCPSNRIAAAALAYTIASDFQVMASQSNEEEGTKCRCPYDGPVLVRAAGGGLQSQTRLAAAVVMLQSLKPPLLMEEDTLPSLSKRATASCDGLDGLVAATRWQLGCQVKGDRILLSADSISAWRASKKTAEAFM